MLAYCVSDLPNYSNCAIIQCVIVVSYDRAMSEQEINNHVFLALASNPNDFHMLKLRTPNLMVAHVPLWILFIGDDNNLSIPCLFHDTQDIYLFESTLQHTLNSHPMIYSYSQSYRESDKTEFLRNRNRTPSDGKTKINVSFVKLDYYKSVHEEESTSLEHRPAMHQNQLILTNVTFMGEFERNSSSTITAAQFEKLLLESVDNDSQQIIFMYQSLRGKSNLPQTPIIDIKSHEISMNLSSPKKNIFEFLGYDGFVAVGVLLTVLIFGVAVYVYQQLYIQKQKKKEKMHLQDKPQNSRMHSLHSSSSNRDFCLLPLKSERDSSFRPTPHNINKDYETIVQRILKDISEN